MDILYAPWRQHFVTRDKAHDACVFCTIASAPELDEHNFVIKRFSHWLLMLNLYPYSSGHLLIIPMQHYQSLDQLTPEQRAEMMEVCNQAINALQHVQHAHGFNVGMNLGYGSGAAFPEHIHLHIVPRWQSGAGFLEVLHAATVISVDLHELYAKIKAQF